MHLNTFQDGFGAALLGRAAEQHAPWLAALASQPGFAVYRNTVLTGCIDALQANYPTVCQLVGETWFRAAAAVYARAQPPCDGRLVDYGSGFSAFLASFAPAAELPYLPAVACLDRAWTECHLAADAPALGRDWLAGQAPGALAATRLRPHPAARWIGCDAHPAYAVWQCHRDGVALPPLLEWTGDGGLLTRPHAEVTWRPIAPPAAAFLNACAEGLVLEAAATRALEAAGPAAAPADFGTLLVSLLDAGALMLATMEPRPG